jgi:hypothetical protein
MRETSSQYSREFLIDRKGTQCINCKRECEAGVIFHHIVPLSIGGNDILTNIVPLCTSCHGLIHHNKELPFSHSDLIKLGLKRAMAEGKHIGRRPTTYDDIDKSFIPYFEGINDKKITVSTAARELHVSRPTIYKYLDLYNNQHKNGGKLL